MKERLLYVKWVDEDTYYGAKDQWVEDCPEGVEPRSIDNPYTFTYQETLEEDWDTWYIVGAIEGYWLGIDIDVGDEHAQTIDFDLDDLRFPTVGCTLVRTPSGGYHLYILLDNEPPRVEVAFDGIDLLSDSPRVGQTGALSPWHDSERDVINEAEPLPFDRYFEDDKLDELFSVDDEPILVERTVKSTRDYDIPAEPPEDVPYCIGQLLSIRNSEAREEYPRGAFWADTHLGQMLAANGYSFVQAMALMEEYPPAKEDGFDVDKTEYHLTKIYRKHERGSLAPPITRLLEAGIDLNECDCVVHGEPEMPWPSFQWRWDEPRSLTEEDIRQRMKDLLIEVLGRDDGVLVEALPGTGKSYTIFVAAKTSETEIAIFVPRGHEETYGEIEEICDELGLDLVFCPDFYSDCPTAASDTGLGEQVRGMRNRGVSPRLIHDEFDLPCQHDGECPYFERYDDIDGADIVAGYYSHANVPLVTNGRRAVFDEFQLEAFETELESVTKCVNHCLENSELPFDTMEDLNTFDPYSRGPVVDNDTHEADDSWEALDDKIPVRPVDGDGNQVVRGNDLTAEIRGFEIETDPTLGISERGHAVAPIIVGTIMFGERRDELRVLHDGPRHCIYSNDDDFWMLDPPGVEAPVALDGTPVKEAWELKLGVKLDHVVLLDEDERTKYITETRQMHIYQTNTAINSVGRNGLNVKKNLERTVALLEEVEFRHEEPPGVVTHPTAKKIFELKGIVDDGRYKGQQVLYYGNLHSSNKFKHAHVGVVTHQSHFGDDYIRRMCIYADEPYQESGRGRNRSYGDFGDRILYHAREQQVLQGILRFGRDESPTWVYVDTAAIPEWLPLEWQGGFYTQTTSTRWEVRKAVEELDGPFRTADVVEQVSVEREAVRRRLKEMRDDGLLKDNGEVGRAHLWLKC